MYNIERKAEIISILERDGKVEVAELAEMFCISKETARRDLRELEMEGVLRRTHGGAVAESSQPKSGEYPVAIREIQRYKEKLAICKKAVSFIGDGDTIFADNSSTTRYIARFLPAQLRVTVITNSLGLLLEAGKRDCEKHAYICAGGIFKGRNLSVYGHLATRTISEFYPDKVFLSCAGIDVDEQVFTDGSLDEVDAKRMMMKNAGEIYMLADHTKWKKRGQVFLRETDGVNYIITDARSHMTDLSALKNVRVCYAD